MEEVPREKRRWICRRMNGVDVMDEWLEEGRLSFVRPPAGVQRRQGLEYVATVPTSEPIDKLEIRRGRLCALSAGMWYIVGVTPASEGTARAE